MSTDEAILNQYMQSLAQANHQVFVLNAELDRLRAESARLRAQLDGPDEKGDPDNLPDETPNVRA